MVGAGPGSLAAPQFEQERVEDILNPHHGKGSTLVLSPPLLPTGNWLPFRNDSMSLNPMPLKLALDLVSAWLKTLFPEDSSSLGLSTYIKTGYIKGQVGFVKHDGQRPCKERPSEMSLL